MISQNGVRANPDKVKAIMDMAPPRNIKEVQRLAGRIAALNKFLSKSAVRGSPFFKTLRRGPQFEWTSECQKAFDDLKVHIAQLQALSSPEPGQTLFIYLSVGEEAISTVLVREDSKVQKPVYYVSRALQGANVKYTIVERYVLMLVHVARKLRSYFQTHPIVVVTDQLLKQILSKPDASGRMVKWVVELSKYDLGYQPWTAIKAQRIAEVTHVKEVVEAEQTREAVKAGQAGEAAKVGQAEEAAEADQARESAEVTHARRAAKTKQAKDAAARRTDSTWTLYVDGVSSKEGCGVRLFLISPTGEELAYALRFDFRASNNEYEYEALIAGMEMTRKLEAESIKVYSDSQLIVNQVLRNYEIKEEPLKKYAAKAHELRSQFKQFTLEQVSRNRNKRPNILSKLASTSFCTLNKEILVEVVKGRAYEQLDMAVIQVMSLWMDPIVQYLANGELPSNKIEARKVLFKSQRYLRESRGLEGLGQEGDAVQVLLAHHLQRFGLTGGKVQVMSAARASSSCPDSGDGPSSEPTAILSMGN
ncbi:uncharacterized protein [Coffea arabica]|uniref:RNase H type-1 domain-containing protein n=1 Tax=Coffea arabica TaxID=13443 RepID=A0A6P6UCR6_COFAR